MADWDGTTTQIVIEKDHGEWFVKLFWAGYFKHQGRGCSIADAMEDLGKKLDLDDQT